MKFFITLYFLLSTQAFAFTLLSNPAAKFSTNNITINVAGNSCAAGGFTTKTLLEWAGEAMDDYWNAVSTSKMKINLGVVNSDDVSGISDSTSFSAATNTIASETIVVGCNSTYFSGSTTTLAVGGIGQNSSGGIVGLIIVNTNYSYQVDHLQDVATIAHEAGHALGIGHSSNEAALMYYSTGAVNNRLAEDDKDALSYLYPNDDFASCGSIAIIGSGNDHDDFSGPMSFVLGLLLIGLFSATGKLLSKGFKNRIILMN